MRPGRLIKLDTLGAVVGTWEGPPGGHFVTVSRLQLSHRNSHMRSRQCIHQFFSQTSEDVQVFPFFETTFYYFFFSCTMVITRFLGGEFAVGVWSEPGRYKFSAGVSSNLGNGSFCVEILDAKHVAHCGYTSSSHV